MEDLIQETLNKFDYYSHKDDGVIDIQRLTNATFCELEPLILSKPIVFVIIEKRILNPIPGSTPDDDLIPRLLRLKADLLNEGKQCRFFEITFHHTNNNRDGIKILALRSFLRDARLVYGSFKGCILIGAFPEAKIAHNIIWAPNFDNESINGSLNTGSQNYLCIADKQYTRCDLPLMDLNGNWENLYHASYNAKIFLALPDAITMATEWQNDCTVKPCVFSTTNYEVRDNIRTDSFIIDDAAYTGLTIPTTNNYRTGPALSFNISPTAKNPEIAGIDQSNPNPIATPDIFISRINPRSVAIDYISHDSYNYDVLLERKLINEYLDLNHRFRTRGFTEMQVGLAYMTSHDFKNSYDDVAIETKLGVTNLPVQKYVNRGGNLIDYIAFLKQPHILKAFIAHSSQWGSVVPGTYAESELKNSAGTRDASSNILLQDDDTAVLSNQGTNANYYLHRALWQNHKLTQDSASIFIHGGCNVNEQRSLFTKQFDDPANDTRVLADSYLFFLKNIAVVCRSTTFNDFPLHFFSGLVETPNTTLGEAYKRIYLIEGHDAELNKKTVERKRIYCWSLLGDWTLIFNPTKYIYLDNPMVEPAHR